MGKIPSKILHYKTKKLAKIDSTVAHKIGYLYKIKKLKKKTRYGNLWTLELYLKRKK